MKTTIYLLMGAMLLTAALAVPGVAQNLIPFKGAIQGQETDTGEFPIITANGSCTGIATVVGQLSLPPDSGGFLFRHSSFRNGKAAMFPMKD
jgi:hypothetical protein